MGDVDEGFEVDVLADFGCCVFDHPSGSLDDRYGVVVCCPDELVDVELVVFEQITNDGGHVGEPPAVYRVADEVEDGHFRGRDLHGPSRCVHRDHRPLRGERRDDECETNASERAPCQPTRGHNLEYLWPLMRRVMYFCRAEIADVVRVAKVFHERVDEMVRWDRAPRSEL